MRLSSQHCKTQRAVWKQWTLVVLAMCIEFGGIAAWAQKQNVSQNQNPSQSQNPGAAQNQNATQNQNAQQSPSSAPAPFDVSKIVPFLNQSLAWYRQMLADQQFATDPSEQVLVTDNRELADEIVRASFEFARAEANAAGSGTSHVQSQNGASTQEQAMLKAQQHMDQEINELDSEIKSLNANLAKAVGKQRQLIQSQIAQTQSELDLTRTRRNAVESMLQFVSGIGTPGENTGLRGQIDALAASVPSLSAPAAAPATKTNDNKDKSQPAAITEATDDQAAGIWELGSNLFGIGQKLSTINKAIDQTDALVRTVNGLRAPLGSRLRQLTQESDKLANEPPAKDEAVVAQQKQEADALTAEYKELAGIAVPLGKATILIGLYEKGLENWHAEVRGDLGTGIGRLGLRLGILLVLIVIVLVFAQIGKRTIYRYVHEPHRRYQFLLLRKIGTWVVIAIIVGLAFASRLESAVTYAGLLTAGIAVALQNVIVAVVGYFFLIGRYGIRVGDRVQISGVTGEVVDIGLVRVHVMELGGSGADTPTGRVVAFSNSIVFQPTAGIFKQIPGTNFVWHEISLTLSAESDFKSVRERLLRAVHSATADYQEEMERQYRALEKSLIAAPENSFEPKIRLRFTSAGLEALVRYPVDLRHAGEIDDRVARELLKAVDQEPKLKLTGAAPAINLHTELPAAGA